MANQTPIFALTAHNESIQFLPADGTTAKKIYTASATDGTRVDEIVLTDNGVNSAVFTLYLRIGGTNYVLGNATVGAFAGYTTNLPTYATQSYFAQQSIHLPASAELWMACTTTLGVGFVIDVSIRGSDY